MAITAPTYASREDVKSALDFAETARNDRAVDRALVSATSSVEALLLRRFYPETDTRYFNWPDRNGARPWRLWLGRDELVSVTTLTAGGDAIAASDFFLEPANSGPPYTHVEIDLASSASFSSGDTHQRAISILGVFGYGNDDETAGALETIISSTTATTIDVTDSALIGVGDLIKIDTERMLVTGKTMLDTTQNLQTSLTASQSNVTVAVTTGSAYRVGETILIDSERMLIVDISGNNLTVKRAFDGTVLAAHTAPTADIYAPRTLTVVRGSVGTTAATHADAAAITRHVYPGPVRSLCIAEAINTLQQEGSAYGRTEGSGDNEKDAAGAGIDGLRAQVLRSHGRARVRIGAV
jgi:hypothetical protein